MKKIISILTCICVVAGVFAACSNKVEDNTTTAYIEKAETITTDQAKITQADAVNLITSYNAEELSLSEEEKEHCSFMVASSGVQLQDDYYIEVIATTKIEHKSDDGEITYTFDNKGEYYIRYDGKQILMKNMENGEYSELEVKSVPVTDQDKA